MPEQDGLNPAERELEEALKSLAPAAARIDPIGAAFEAGRRSVRSQVRVWRAATAAAILIGIGSWVLSVGPGIGTHVPVVAITVPSISQPLPPQSLFMLQAAYRDKGLAGLPATNLPPVGATRSADLL